MAVESMEGFIARPNPLRTPCLFPPLISLGESPPVVVSAREPPTSSENTSIPLGQTKQWVGSMTAAEIYPLEILVLLALACKKVPDTFYGLTARFPWNGFQILRQRGFEKDREEDLSPSRKPMTSGFPSSAWSSVSPRTGMLPGTHDSLAVVPRLNTGKI